MTNPILDDLRIYRNSQYYRNDPAPLYRAWYGAFKQVKDEDIPLTILYGSPATFNGQAVTRKHVGHAVRVLKRLVILTYNR